MHDIAILYGTNTGNTERVAEMIRGFLPEKNVFLINVGIASREDLEDHDNLIFGAPTWGLAEIQQDWERYLATLEKADLSGKNIALYGLGDQFHYYENFVDGMGDLYTAIEDKDCRIIGQWPVEGYNFGKSRALVNNNFVGLPIDEVNQPDYTLSRIKKWVSDIKPYF
jgi:flavodoxin I